MATEKRLSPSMFRALTNLHRGRPVDDHVFGRSEAGGFSGTLMALEKRGFIEYGKEIQAFFLTEDGQHAREREIEQQAKAPRKRLR